MKRFTLVILLCTICSGIFAQQIPALPCDPEVKTGQLDNGLTYYIRHNALPEGRCEFYLCTKAGAILETPDQDGLAHFLEHMCFNGLKNLPGKQMLDYLQHIGAEFGRNINASTGVETTSYMLNNIPVSREGIIDTCLLVLHDYSHFVVNDPKEIDAERGVILEEKRTRDQAGWRNWINSKPYIYGDCKYADCSLIGSEENLKNFKPESLVNFYKAWYQPDNQAVIIVGDVDVEQIYQKLVKLFADVPAPQKPTVRNLPEVPLNDAPVVGIITDKESTSTDVEFIWKMGKPFPREIQGSIYGYQKKLLLNIAGKIMNERISDIASKAGAPFLGGNFMNYNLSETCEAFVGDVVCENAKALDAVKAYYTEIEKMRRFGFNDDEFERAKANILKNLNDKVTGKSTRKNQEFIRSLQSHFFNGDAYLTPEDNLQGTQLILSKLSIDIFNKALFEFFKGEHLSIIYSGIDKEGQVHPTKEQLLETVNAVKASKIEAPVQAVVNKDFMAGRTLKGGEITDEKSGLYGSTEWTLSNGLKVVVLPTTYKKDQVIFKMFRKGGKNLVATKDLASFNDAVLNVFSSCSGVANYPSTSVSKMLSGKNLNVNYFISSLENGVQGNSSPEDLETALQIMYLLYTEPRFDKEEWSVAINQLKSYIPNLVSTPDYLVQKHMIGSLYGGNERARVIDEEIVGKANLGTLSKYFKQMYSGVDGASLYIIGNVDLATLKPLIAKYAGSLPKGKKAPVWNEKNFVSYAKAMNNDIFKTKMTTSKATCAQFYAGPMEFSVKKSVDFDASSFIMDMIYTETLREQEGGTYGAGCYMLLTDEPTGQFVCQIAFDTNLEKQEALRKLAVKGMKTLAENGPTAEQLTRVIENSKKNLPEKRITNRYWLNALVESAKLGIDYDKEKEAAIAGISAEGIKAAMQEIFSLNNFAEVVMLPE